MISRFSVCAQAHCTVKRIFTPTPYRVGLFLLKTRTAEKRRFYVSSFPTRWVDMVSYPIRHAVQYDAFHCHLGIIFTRHRIPGMLVCLKRRFSEEVFYTHTPRRNHLRVRDVRPLFNPLFLRGRGSTDFIYPLTYFALRRCI